MFHISTVFTNKKQSNNSQKDPALQAMEKCYVQKFKHRLKYYGSKSEAQERVAQYARDELLFPMADDIDNIGTDNTLRHIKAICGAAYRTKIPLSPYTLWYVQNQAELAKADKLAVYMQQQHEHFKKVHIWLRCSPFANLNWIPER